MPSRSLGMLIPSSRSSVTQGGPNAVRPAGTWRWRASLRSVRPTSLLSGPEDTCMDSIYVDRRGCAMTRQEVHGLPAEALSERSGIPFSILPDREALYEAVAEVMIDSIETNNKQGAKTTMILPVGPVGQYPVFARKVAERGIDCRGLWTFNMDEFLDRNGRTIPEDHLMSF